MQMSVIGRQRNKIKRRRMMLSSEKSTGLDNLICKSNQRRTRLLSRRKRISVTSRWYSIKMRRLKGSKGKSSRGNSRK